MIQSNNLYLHIVIQIATEILPEYEELYPQDCSPE